MPGKVILTKEDDKTRLKRAEREEVRARATGEAVQCMKRFFAGKPYYKPYPDPKDATKTLTDIPQETLISPTNIDIVLDTDDLNDAMAFAQDTIAELAQKGVPLVRSGKLTRDSETELFLGLIREFKSLEIPFQYQGGMMLLYLWLCEGVEFK